MHLAPTTASMVSFVSLAFEAKLPSEKMFGTSPQANARAGYPGAGISAWQGDARCAKVIRSIELGPPSLTRELIIRENAHYKRGRNYSGH